MRKVIPRAISSIVPSRRCLRSPRRASVRATAPSRCATLLPGLIDKIDEWHTNPNALRGLSTGFAEFDR